jgi:hypothetical protein
MRTTVGRPQYSAVSFAPALVANPESVFKE